MARPRCNYIALYEAEWGGDGEAKGSVLYTVLHCDLSCSIENLAHNQ